MEDRGVAASRFLGRQDLMACKVLILTLGSMITIPMVAVVTISCMSVLVLIIIGLTMIIIIIIVKLREREGQRVDLGRSLKGHL